MKPHKAYNDHACGLNDNKPSAVYCRRVYTHEQQMERVVQIPDIVVEDDAPFRLVVCKFVASGWRG